MHEEITHNFRGAEGVRTPDLLVANQALSQLSYSPRLNAEHSPGPTLLSLTTITDTRT
jgi:hypothetical protein